MVWHDRTVRVDPQRLAALRLAAVSADVSATCKAARPPLMAKSPAVSR